MINIPKWLQRFFMLNTGYTYSNLSRLFLRLFTGVMFLQLGVRQMTHLESFSGTAMGAVDPSVMVAIMVIEIVCAVFIILGLFTRLALLPSIAVMIYAECILPSPSALAGVDQQMFFFEPGYPVMFLGIFVFMLLAGPGKISLDYLISIHTIDEKVDDNGKVLEKA